MYRDSRSEGNTMCSAHVFVALLTVSFRGDLGQFRVRKKAPTDLVTEFPYMGMYTYGNKPSCSIGIGRDPHSKFRNLRL